MLLGLCGLLIFVGCKGQVVPNELSNRLRTCDTQFVLLTILKSEKLANYFPQNELSKYYDENNHTLDVINELKLVTSYYKEIKNTDEVLQVIDNWCTTNQIISEIGEVNADYPAEAILYYTNKTKPLVLKYLSDSRQDWASLSTYQLYELNIDFLNFMDKLTEEQKTKLLLGLRATADSLSQ